MTEPPLFGSAAGSGPSPAAGGPSSSGETPPGPAPAPMAMPGAGGPPPGPEPTAPLGDWSSYGAPTAYPPLGAGSPPAGGPAGQPSQADWTYGPGPTATPIPPSTRPRPAGRGRLVVVAAIIVLVAAAGVAVFAAGGGTPGSGASPTPDRGTVVFSDDFKDPKSGWTTDTLPSGTSYEYTDHGYVVVAIGELDHLSDAPTVRPRPKITASVTATQSAGAPDGAGFGVACVRGLDATEIRYEFVAAVSAVWTVSRLESGPSARRIRRRTCSSTARSPLNPGSTPMTVEGTCATQADGKTTRLVFVVDGATVAELTDEADSLPDDGWYPELIVSSMETPSTVTVTHFEVRTVPQ